MQISSPYIGRETTTPQEWSGNVQAPLVLGYPEQVHGQAALASQRSFVKPIGAQALDLLHWNH